jgi:hypothetical protein
MQPHASICHASIVDITPTILDLLGLLPAFERSVASRPSDLKGQSLKTWLESSLTPSAEAAHLCDPLLKP